MTDKDKLRKKLTGKPLAYYRYKEKDWSVVIYKKEEFKDEYKYAPIPTKLNRRFGNQYYFKIATEIHKKATHIKVRLEGKTWSVLYE